MAAARLDRRVVAVGVDGLLFVEDGGGRLEGDTEDDVFAVGDAALNAAGAVVSLNRPFDRGRVTRLITHPNFAVPATAAFFAGGLYVTNARFDTPYTPSTRYWVVRIPIGDDD